METKQNSEPTKWETLLGGVDYEARKLDGSTEAVRIRQLPVRLMDQYLNVLNDEPKVVELLCGRPAGWSDCLSNESFEKIVEEGTRVNADFFERFLARKANMVSTLHRLAGAHQAVVERLASATLPTTLPNSRSAAA
jgi:hypothetical protein